MHGILVITAAALTMALCVMILLKSAFTLTKAALLTGLMGLAAVQILQWPPLAPAQNIPALLQWSLIVQGLAIWSFLAFSIFFARSGQDQPSTPAVISAALFAALPLLPLAQLFQPGDMLALPQPQTPGLIPLTRLGFGYHLGLLAALLMCLYNLEATLANATHINRWRIKFFTLGLMAVLASQFLSASMGLLYLALDLSLNPARQTGLILGAALMGYSLLFRAGETRIVFSRRLAYKSLVLFAAGVYLAGLGLIGRLLPSLHGLPGKTTAAALSVTGAVGLAAVFLSETARRKTALLLHKYFYNDKYDYRAQWLEFNRRMALALRGADLCPMVVGVFCENFGMGQGALYLRAQASRRFEPAYALEMDAQPLTLPDNHPLLKPLAKGLAVQDLRHGEPASTASFLVPLGLDGALMGFILLGRPFDPKEAYDEEDFELMEAMARQASLALLNARLAEELAGARELEAMGKVSSFVLHDLKNLAHALSLVTENAERFIREPPFQRDLITTLRNTVTKVNRLIARLCALPSQRVPNRETVNLLALARESAKTLSGVTITGAPTPAAVDREEISKVMVNLFRNAQEAGHDPVLVEIGGDTHPFIKVSDTGCGMDEEFIRTKLFVPFATTKKQGMGIGLYQCKQIVEAHGGSLEVTSRLDHGSTFTVLLPAPLHEPKS